MRRGRTLVLLAAALAAAALFVLQDPTFVRASPNDFQCFGEWAGPVRASSGPTGTLSVRLQAPQGACGTFTERWTGLNTCHYTLGSCAIRGNVLAARASTPQGERVGGGCNPVPVRFTCEGSTLRFREDSPHTLVTATLARAR